MNLHCFVMVSAANFDHQVQSPQIFPVCGNIIPSCGVTGMQPYDPLSAKCQLVFGGLRQAALCSKYEEIKL